VLRNTVFSEACVEAECVRLGLWMHRNITQKIRNAL